MASILNKSAIWVFILAAFCGSPALFAAEPAPPKSDAGDWDSMRDIRPREYMCHFTSEPIAIDGRADERAWQGAPWTDDFVDIEGARRPRPTYRTRAKMLWNDDFLFIHAELDEPHVWGTITKRNEVIFRDNDFEIFLNPAGDNHRYHEFEMNALNTIWELTLDKPYRDGGPLHDPDNVPGLKTAVHVRGTINDPRDVDQGWSVEIAFPWAGLKKYAGEMACPPREGDVWRMGFSRVEWKMKVVEGRYQKDPAFPHEDNWIWSPQGIINMHAPERWGRVGFTRKPFGKGEHVAPDPVWPAREALMEIYHRQRVYHDQHKHYAASLAELGWPDGNTSPFPADDLKIESTADGYLATATMKLADGKTAVLHTRQDSHLWRDDDTNPKR